MPNATRPSFFLVIVDRDARRFTVVWPTYDDTPYNTAVTELQQRGRNVNCFTGVGRSAEEIADAYGAQTGNVYTTERIV
jgi:hypothetical protein